MPNLLIYAPIIGRGGVHRMITRLLEHWRNVPDWKITVLSQAVDEIGTPIDWQKVEFIQLDGGEPPRHPLLFAWLQANQSKFYAHWKRVAKQKKIDLTYLPMPWWTTRLPDFQPVTPYVVTVHDFSWDQLQKPAHEFRAEARIFAAERTGAALAIFPSEYQRQWGEQHYGYRNTRTIYHGHFIPPNFMATPSEGERVREKYGLPRRYVLAFHCANDKKDPETILAAQYIARSNSANVPPLVIAGLESELFVPNRIPREHQAYGYARHLWDVLAMHGYTLGQDLFVIPEQIPNADMGGLYANAACAVTATLNEGGISGSMFEAFAAHVPCVYTGLPMFTERLNPPGDYGFVFSPGDVQWCANGIYAACNDTDEAFRRAANAFAFANSRTWSDAAAEYMEAFNTLIST